MTDGSFHEDFVVDPGTTTTNSNQITTSTKNDETSTGTLTNPPSATNTVKDNTAVTTLPGTNPPSVDTTQLPPFTTPPTEAKPPDQTPFLEDKSTSLGTLGHSGKISRV